MFTLTVTALILAGAFDVQIAPSVSTTTVTGFKNWAECMSASKKVRNELGPSRIISVACTKVD